MLNPHIMEELDKETRQAYEEYWRLRGVRDYEDERMLLLGMLVPLGVLGVLIYITLDNVSNERVHNALKICMSMCVLCVLACAVVVHWRHRAKCNHTSSFKFDWPYRFEQTAETDLCAFIGVGIWAVICVVTLCIDFVGVCNFVIDVVCTIAASIYEFLAGVACTDAEIGTVARGHAPFIVLSFVFCLFVRVPWVMCQLDSFSRFAVLVYDFVYGSACFTFPCLVLGLAIFAFVCWVDPTGEGCKKIYNKSIYIARGKKMMNAVTGTTLLIASEQNINAITTTIATKAPTAKTFDEVHTGPKKRRRDPKPLKNHFSAHCLVDGRKPTEEDIKKVLADNNIANTTKPDAIKLYVMKELKSLGLLVP